MPGLDLDNNNNNNRLERSRKNLFVDRRLAACLVVAFGLVVGPQSATANTDACGAPELDIIDTPTVAIWRSCPGNTWHLRGLAPSWTVFKGGVDAAAPIVSFTAIEYEASDILELLSPNELSFTMGLKAPYRDGFDFELIEDTTACISIDAPANVSVVVGAASTPVAREFTTATLGPCDIPVLAVDDIVVSEDVGKAQFAVRLDRPAPAPVTAFYDTIDVTATAGSDYIAAAGTLHIDTGATSAVIEIDINDDLKPENAETFNLSLSQPTNALLPGEPATATITDNDTACWSPALNYSSDRGVFLWKDCNTGIWSARFLGGGGSWLSYEGGVSTDTEFTSVTPIQLETNDTLSVDGDIAFSLGVVSVWQDGFDFQVSSDTGTCFDSSSEQGTVNVGAWRKQVEPPFDLRTLGPCDGSAHEPPGHNVVVVFADDLRFGTLPMMPAISSRLIPHGVLFENAYVPTPLCCPARASTYSGGYLAQNTGVLDNGDPNGGRLLFNDSVNLGTRFQLANYRTQFVGKWLNDYPLMVPRVPPGWDNFVGRAVWASGRSWFQFEYLEGSSDQNAGIGDRTYAYDQYHVDYERDKILEFINDVPDDENFFVFWATTPPHPPAVPHPNDVDAFSDFTYRERGVGETDLSDKPKWVQTFDPTRPAFQGDEAIRDQLRSMLSVDRGVGAIVDSLAARGRLDDTVFIITSDNGYMWGEHRLWGKPYAYEESIRVPLLVTVPGIPPRREDNLVSAVLDLGPTIFDIAGISAPASDGVSLLPLLRDETIAWRDELYFERYGTSTWVNALWMALRRGDWKYVQYWNGDEELYDLANDPFELESLDSDPAYDDIRESLRTSARSRQGPTIKPLPYLPAGTVDAPYTFQFQVWGGQAPFTWTLNSGSLPDGLSLDPHTGTLSGVPAEAGHWSFTVRVTGSGIGTQSGRQRTYVTAVRELDIQPAPAP